MSSNHNEIKQKSITRFEHQKALRRRKKIKLIKQNLIFVFLFILFSGLIIFNVIDILKWNDENKKIKNLSEEINSIIKVETIKEEGTLINPPIVEEKKEDDYWYYIKVPFYDVDFSELFKKNNDTVGFISVKNTNINYPIVQSKDNKFYLTHTYDKTKNNAGWVYMDYRNKNSFSDDNTIIYGHGRLNKTVFGSLKDLLTKKWQSNKDNYVINISTPTYNYVYQIFSIYTIESEDYYITPSFDNIKDKKVWINTMRERNSSVINTTVDENDKVLTLSTCLNTNDGRIVVHAKLIKKSK